MLREIDMVPIATAYLRYSPALRLPWIASALLDDPASGRFGQWVFDRACEPDDGRFEVITVQSRAEWIARVVGDLAHNPAPLEHEQLAARRFDLRFYRQGDEAIASQIDGEEWARGDRFRVEVQANALPLITPRAFVPPWKSAR